MTRNEPGQRIPEERVATILARAADLDRTARETVSLDVIRTAALEAGISPAAVDRALAEYAAGKSVDPAALSREKESARGGRWRRWMGKVVTGLKFAVPTFVVAALIAATGEAGVPLAVMGWIGWVLFAGRMAWKSRTVGRASGFVQRIAVMTFAACLGTLMVLGGDGFLAALLVTGVILMVSGSLAIKLRWSPAEYPRELTEPIA